MTKISNLKAGERVEGNYVIKFKKPIESYAHGFFFQLRVGDSTGEIMLKYWGGNDEEKVKGLYDSLNKNDVIKVVGKVVRFRDKLEINVDETGEIKKLKEGEYDIQEFIRVTKKDIEEMYLELMRFVESVEKDDYKKVLSVFIKDFDFVSKFKKQPAAMYMHHSWIGGLLEHTLEVVKMCDALSKLYPQLDRDLMITGAILHDIGKIKEFEIKTSIRTSKEGMLLSHVVLGLEEAVKRFENLDIDEEIKLKLMHIIVSHHGREEWGAIKRPAFPEALAIFFADYSTSKLVEMITSKEEAKTEDDYIYTKSLGLIYLK